MIRRPKSVCLEHSLFEIKNTSISPSLRPPRTDFVSLDKTNALSVRSAYSFGAEGGGGGGPRNLAGARFPFDENRILSVKERSSITNAMASAF